MGTSSDSREDRETTRRGSSERETSRESSTSETEDYRDDGDEEEEPRFRGDAGKAKVEYTSVSAGRGYPAE